LIDSQLALETSVKTWVEKRVETAQTDEETAQSEVTALEAEEQQRKQDLAAKLEDVHQHDKSIGEKTAELKAEADTTQQEFMEFVFTKDDVPGYVNLNVEFATDGTAGFTLPAAADADCQVQTCPESGAAFRKGMRVGDTVVGLTIAKTSFGVSTFSTIVKQRFNNNHFVKGKEKAQKKLLTEMMVKEGYIETMVKGSKNVPEASGRYVLTNKARAASPSLPPPRR
jgi:hypothetical protein